MNYDQYHHYGWLGFPYPERVYFDHHGYEFTYNTIEQKLLDIAYLLWHGYDVRSDIHHTYSEDHPSVSQSTVYNTILYLMKHIPDSGYAQLLSRPVNIDILIDIFFSRLLRLYHIPTTCNKPHFMKQPSKLTESELRECNPWEEVARNYDFRTMLFSSENNQVCSADRAMIEDFNAHSEPDFQYRLNVPAYPWYGNPLKAKVIVLSLNPGYSEKESTIAKLIQLLPERNYEGYCLHICSMLTFDCGGFLPSDYQRPRLSDRDIANIHQSWYWYDRLNQGFLDGRNGLSFEDVNHNFAVIQYIGYHSKRFAPFKKNQILPSQQYTRQLIDYILHNNRDTIFIVPRNVNTWRKFLGNLWDDMRFITTSDYRGQHLTKSTLKENYDRVVAAFKSKN